MIAPILEELATELAGKLTIGKVNVDDNGALAAQFGIRAIPTLVLFKGGQVAEQYVGLMDKATLKSKLTAKM
jgi:thioredoxin 1